MPHLKTGTVHCSTGGVLCAPLSVRKDRQDRWDRCQGLRSSDVAEQFQVSPISISHVRARGPDASVLITVILGLTITVSVLAVKQCLATPSKVLRIHGSLL